MKAQKGESLLNIEILIPKFRFVPYLNAMETAFIPNPADRSDVAPASREILISGRNLRRSFRIGPRTIDVLRGIDIDIYRGEIVFLCGASGAGKTTLLYTLAGLEHPEAGKVLFEDADLYAMSDGRRATMRNARIGFVFQGYFLLPELTALENVALPQMIGGKANLEKAKESLVRVGLAERLHHLPAELSGGEQQRVAIARALINEPAVLFADEPTGNLDSVSGKAVMDLLVGVARDAGSALVIVTHDRVLAQTGDRMLEVRDGNISA